MLYQDFIVVTSCVLNLPIFEQTPLLYNINKNLYE